MAMTPLQYIVMVLAVALGAMATRFAPFILFPEGKQPPELITYLGKVLPPVMMGLLVVYCLKDIPIQASPHGLPELISIAFIVLIHLWRKNVLLSIGCGTALYMILVPSGVRFVTDWRILWKQFYPGVIVTLKAGNTRCSFLRRIRKRWNRWLYTGNCTGKDLSGSGRQACGMKL